MSNEKLRDAIKRLLKAHRITVQAPPKTITEAENQLREIENAVKYAEEALATTEPEPTGMPEGDLLNRVVANRLRFEKWATDSNQGYDLTRENRGRMSSYLSDHTEHAWRGYCAAALATTEPTSKQPLQVEPAVNQQLTTEPFDEREAFEKWAMPNRFDVGHKGEDGSYLGMATSIAWEAWQARAAMTQVGDINVVESFTNDTKDAERYRWLMRFEVWPEDVETAIDISSKHMVDAAIDAAMAKGVK